MCRCDAAKWRPQIVMASLMAKAMTLILFQREGKCCWRWHWGLHWMMLCCAVSEGNCQLAIIAPLHRTSMLTGHFGANCLLLKCLPNGFASHLKCSSYLTQAALSTAASTITVQLTDGRATESLQLAVKECTVSVSQHPCSLIRLM